MAKRAQTDIGRGTIQWIVGLLCSGILSWMLYLSGGPGHSYDLVAIVGMLVLISILLEKHELLIKLFQIWRGGSDNSDMLRELIEDLDGQKTETEQSQTRAQEREDGHDDTEEADQRHRREGDSRGSGGDGDRGPGRHP